MKKVLGLDLGTTSIGWAVVNQAENDAEKSSIVKAGVRIVPLSADEKDSFEKGKAITTNAARTQKRSMRRNLQRYKQRREHLISILLREGWITEKTILAESGPGSTYKTFKIRANAPVEEISLEDLARVLLMINRKRGYKSNRKTDIKEEGSLIDGMEIARTLYDEHLTPGQMSLRLLRQGRKSLPDYYRSDLENEFHLIWNAQQQWYPEILTDDFKHQVSQQGGNGASKIFLGKYGIYTADNKGKDKKRIAVEWRVAALTQKLEKDVLAYVISDLRSSIQNSSGYLGAISDRSKELFFRRMTVGQYLYAEIQIDHNYSTKNKVFYRQDYLDEFERIWENQRQYHPELTDSLKREIRDTVIFYQRNLKSQKGLVSFCELESRKVEVIVDGKKKSVTSGSKVAPRSSLLFQEFKVWSVLNNITVCEPLVSSNRFTLSLEQKQDLYNELTVKEKMSDKEVLRFLGYKPGRYELNYKEVEGNRTLCSFYGKFLQVVNESGHGEYSLSKMRYEEAYNIIKNVFIGLGFNAGILDFDSGLEKKRFEQQPLFKLWHLLYSYEGDKSKTGNLSLVEKIAGITNMPREYALIIAGLHFADDYASLSHKAMSRILPYLKEGNDYSVACMYAGYNHSNSMTKEQRDGRELKNHLDLLPKGSLHNPVVEKILNQMVNVVNSIYDTYGKMDEIHIEFARELKQSAVQRNETARRIADRAKENEAFAKTLKEDFGLSYVGPAEILRYRLYEELKGNGYKTLYSNQPIHRGDLFSPLYNIEHIIPQALLFDDSFSNKTLELTDVNIKKGKRTAADFVLEEYSDTGYEDYKLRVDDLYQRGVISRTKHANLLMRQSEIPSDFLNRDLTNSQYIARKAGEMLLEIVRFVMPTTGSVTARLREDWQLVDVMKELNFAKYQAAGLTFSETRYDGHTVNKIKGWNKRNDHRHHAMDAITIAFTRPSHIQLLNSLNACTGAGSEAYAIKQKETVTKGGSWAFIPPVPMEAFRPQVKDALDNILVSIKSKNKVVTKNINRIKTKKGNLDRTELTPRGELHKEQVYGLRRKYEVKYLPIGAKMTRDVIATVADKRQRENLLSQLEQYGGDPEKAFTGKNASKDKVKCVTFSTYYGIRKAIGPDLKVDKVVDTRIRSLLLKRLLNFGNDPRKAFSDLDNNPIWFDEARRIKIKSVTIGENFDLSALHDKKDNNGNCITDASGNRIPADFVNLRNNHHIAIYDDGEGNYHEYVVPFMVALDRVNMGIPVVDRNYKKEDGWRFVFSLKNNEMFVFPNPETGFDPSDIDLTDPKNYSLISPNLYRVQKLSSGCYYFRHHLETMLTTPDELRNITWKRISSCNNLRGVVKVRINHLGLIVAVGEDG